MGTLHLIQEDHKGEDDPSFHFKSFSKKTVAKAADDSVGGEDESREVPDILVEEVEDPRI